MRGQLTTIKPDGTTTFTSLSASPTLEQLQTAVGGHLEVVPLFTHLNGETCVVFCNEEGKLEGLEPNDLAQLLWEKAVGRPIRDDYLVGPIAIITGDRALLAAL
jgi:Domain of unknown function (DUF3846)